MIICRVNSKDRFRRKCASRVRYLAPLAGSTDLKAFRVCESTTNETDKSGEKKPQENRDARQQGPFFQNSFPHTKKQDQICPEEKFRIVPFPRGELNKAAGQKDEGGRKKEKPKHLSRIPSQWFGRK